MHRKKSRYIHTIFDLKISKWISRFLPTSISLLCKAPIIPVQVPSFFLKPNVKSFGGLIAEVKFITS